MRKTVLFLLALGGASLAGPARLPAQYGLPGRGIQIPKEQVKIAGTIKAMRGALLQVEGGKGEQWIVKAPTKPQYIHVTGPADPDWVGPGMFVRFSASFDKRGQSHDPVNELEVFVPQKDTKIGMFPDAGIGGGLKSLFSDSDTIKKKPTIPTTPYKVVGRVTGAKKGKLTVAAGVSAVKIKLGERAKVWADVYDLRLAQPGDKVAIDGWHLPNQKTQIYANQMTITPVTPLGSSNDGKDGGKKKKW